MRWFIRVPAYALMALFFHYYFAAIGSAAFFAILAAEASKDYYDSTPIWIVSNLISVGVLTGILGAATMQQPLAAVPIYAAIGVFASLIALFVAGFGDRFLAAVRR
jgi:hypothetical protein